ncbi:MAG: hypothetical protein WAO12_02430 [Venatoribacter sp.]
MSRFWKISLLLLFVYAAVSQWQQRGVKVYGQESITPHQPIQHILRASEAPEFQVKNYQLKAQASYRIEARLLRRENYRFGREAELSPVDFALGWGPMAANSLLDQLTITQSNRFYWLRWQELSVPTSVVMQHSANTHIIPADKYVAKNIDAMRPGQVVELEGYLVNVRSTDGWYWNTSLTRNDTGAGACELFWVESARVMER